MFCIRSFKSPLLLRGSLYSRLLQPPLLQWQRCCRFGLCFLAFMLLLLFSFSFLVLKSLLAGGQSRPAQSSPSSLFLEWSFRPVSYVDAACLNCCWLSGYLVYSIIPCTYLYNIRSKTSLEYAIVATNAYCHTCSLLLLKTGC